MTVSGKRPSISQLKLDTYETFTSRATCSFYCFELEIPEDVGYRGAHDKHLTVLSPRGCTSQCRAVPYTLAVPSKEEQARGQMDRRGGKGSGWPRSPSVVAVTALVPSWRHPPFSSDTIVPCAEWWGWGRGGGLEGSAGNIDKKTALPLLWTKWPE